MSVEVSEVYSILVLDKKVLGVRAKKGKHLFDIEIDKFEGITAAAFKGYKIDRLIEHGNLLVTQEELDKDLLIIDESNNPQLVQEVLGSIIAKVMKEKAKEVRKTVKPRSKSESSTDAKPAEKKQPEKKRVGSKTFIVTIESNEYNPKNGSTEPKQFSGEFKAITEKAASKKAVILYARELNAAEEDIKVVSVTVK